VGVELAAGADAALAILLLVSRTARSASAA
jgi:hypothetical protein